MEKDENCQENFFKLFDLQSHGIRCTKNELRRLYRRLPKNAPRFWDGRFYRTGNNQADYESVIRKIKKTLKLNFDRVGFDLTVGEAITLALAIYQSPKIKRMTEFESLITQYPWYFARKAWSRCALSYLRQTPSSAHKELIRWMERDLTEVKTLSANILELEQEALNARM